MCAMNKTKQKQKTQQNLVRLSIKKTIKRQNSKIIRRPSPGVQIVYVVGERGRGGAGRRRGGWGISCTFSSSSTQIIWESSSLEHHLLPISQSNTGFTNLKCKYVRTSNQQASRYPPVYLTYHAAAATQVSKKLNAIS